MDNPVSTKRGLLALSPLVVFLGVYLVSSIAAGDFYKIPVASAFLLASIYAVAIMHGRSLRERMDIFTSGAANPGVLKMIWIFILAGAFASSAKAIGAVDATVALTLRILPGNLIFAGFFLAACFISMAVGTSVGTIVALMPVAAELAAETGIEVPFMAAIVVGGAFFGDNLSFISDTTIAATTSQGCPMRDKFKANILIVGPAAIIVAAIYIFKGLSVNVVPHTEVLSWIKILPYLLIIGLALAGMDVNLVLVAGILLCSVMGLAGGILSWSDLLESFGTGIAGMGDLITVTLLAGGLLAVIRASGGLDFIISRLTRGISGVRGAEFSIAALVSLANLCTANNTIAIITVGDIAKSIASRFGIDPRKAASLLDTFSCFVQGLIPYGAQLLMAAGLAGVSTVEIIPYLYYPFVMGICAVLAIIFRFPRGISARKLPAQ